MKRWVAAAGGMLLALGLAVPFVPAATLAQSEACPLISDAEASAATGLSLQVFEGFGVNVSGSNTECLFSGDDLGLVRRQAGFFAPDAPSTPEVIERLRTIVAREELDYTPVDGIGDAAYWATVRDPSLAGQRMSLLIVRRGPDAFVFGLTAAPNLQDTVRALGQAVLARPLP
jgi:hypothetical protein